MKEYDQQYFINYKDQKSRWNFWSRYLKKISKKEEHILEIGCGFAYLFSRLKEYKNLYGIDVSEYAIKEAAKRNSGAKFAVMNAEKTKFKKEMFDLIISFDCIEHIQNPKKALKDWKRILKKKGRIIITTPNLDAKSHEEKGQNWFAYQDETHISLKTPEEWKGMIEEQGFEIEKIRSFDQYDRKKRVLLRKIENILRYKINKPFIRRGDNLFIQARKR